MNLILIIGALLLIMMGGNSVSNPAVKTVNSSSAQFGLVRIDSVPIGSRVTIPAHDEQAPIFASVNYGDGGGGIIHVPAQTATVGSILGNNIYIDLGGGGIANHALIDRGTMVQFTQVIV